MEISQKYCNGFKKPSQNELEEGGSLKSVSIASTYGRSDIQICNLNPICPRRPPPVAYDWANTRTSVLKKLDFSQV